MKERTKEHVEKLIQYMIHTNRRMTLDILLEALKFNISLRHANLYGATLYGANLNGANLYGANLDGATLYGANLDGANLNRATLNGANLDGATLNRANLDGANLNRATLDGANLNGATLYGANLDGATLYGANLNRATLYGATLYGANLDGANLDGATLNRANLDGAQLTTPINMTSANFDIRVARDKNDDFTYYAGCFSGNASEMVAKSLKVRNSHQAKQIYYRCLSFCANTDDEQIFLDAINKLNAQDSEHNV